MRSSLSACPPGLWHDASPDILMGRRGGGVPANRTRPAMEALPIA
jgi:hypothetical protein